MKWIALGLCLFASGATLPTFDRYPANEKFSGTPAVPVLRTRLQRTFRTVIREAAQAGANFAGHYALAQWGCGAGCVSMAIVDNKTGRTTDGPFNLLGYDLAYTYEGGEEQLEFRNDSGLVIARGCPGEKDCGTYYYEWTGDQFKLLRKTPGQRKPRENP